MIVAAKLEMSDFEQALDMKVLDWAIFQAASEGLEYGRPKLRDVRFTFFDSKLIPYFFEWAKSGNSKRSGKIYYISSDMAKVEYCFSFKDAVCSGCYVHFIANEELPLSCDVSLSVSLEKQDLVKGKGEKAKQLNRQSMAPTPLSVDKETQDFTDAYLLDSKGSKIKDLDGEQDVTLVIKSSGLIGKMINAIDLHNDEYDFIYEGKRLIDDKLKNYTIKSNEDKLALKAIKQNQSNS